MKKDYLSWVFVGIAVVGIIMIATSTNKKGGDTNNVSPSPTDGIGPKPTLIIGEVKTYEQWAAQHDYTGTRLVLNETCTLIVPSNVTYKNNTQIMIDNRVSNEPRTLKIGERWYDLVPRGYYLTTLYSSKLPAKLTIFCGPMELGQIDLE